MTPQMKYAGNGSTVSNGHHLRSYKFLKLEPAIVRNIHLKLIFVTFATFCIGVIIGFNVKDIMIQTCGTATSSIVHQPIRREVLKVSKPKNERIPFEQLPEKYLKNIPMPPPANSFPLRPWKITDMINDSSDANPPFFLTILVKSAVSYARRRFQIRQTWGSMKSIEGKKIAVIFVIGLATSKIQQEFLEKENKLYGDIVQGDIKDTYRNLPLKVLSGYQYIVEHFGNASEYYVSTDDDCFINIPNTYEYFTDLDPAKRNAAHCGYIYSARSSRISNPRSKWGVAEEFYPMTPYPKFCHGGMTILSHDILRDIYRVSLITNYTGFHLEDVLTNGILREKLNRGDESIRQIVLRDKKTNKRKPLMWHLGYKKDKEESFDGIWRGIKRMLGFYDGPYDPVRGYRAELSSNLPTLEGQTLQETIEFFGPVVNRKGKASR